MPTARLGLAACAVDGKLYAIGGYAVASGSGLKTVEEYDPATDSWTARADMPTGRRWLAATAVDGKCYAIGGHPDGASAGLATLEEYDPATDAWTSRADMPSGRLGLSAATVDGKIVVAGGGTASTNPVSSVLIYDPATDQWTSAADLPRMRGFFAAAAAVDDQVYLVGGSEAPMDVDVYDPANDTWSPRANLPSGRTTLAASAVDGKLYVFGGRSGTSSPPTRTVRLYDPVEDTWTGLASLPSARWGLASAVIRGRVHAVGGTEIGPPPHPGITANDEYTPPGATPDEVRRCFLDAETMAPVADVRVSPRKGPELVLDDGECSDEVPFQSLTIEAPGFRTRETHAVNGKLGPKSASLPGENGTYFLLFPDDSTFTDLIDAGRTRGKKKRRGILQGLPGLKLEIIRPSDFPMSAGQIKRGAKKELRKRAKFPKPSVSKGDTVELETQILLRHVPGSQPSVECSILDAGVCWGPVVSFDAAAGNARTALEQGLRLIFYRGKDLPSGSDAKDFYRGFRASVVGQRLKRGKETDVVPDSAP